MGWWKSITRRVKKAARSVASEAVDVVAVAATPVTAVAVTAVNVAQGERIDRAIGRGAKHAASNIERGATRGLRLARSAGVEAVPVVGTAIGTALKVQELQHRAGLGNVTRTVQDVASGVRVDKALGRAAKRQVQAYDELAPYAAAALSTIPGPGQGMAAAISAAHALAHGRPVTEALIQAARAAIPGGAVAQAAFSVAAAAAQGKPIEQALIAGLPLGPTERRALEQAATVAKAVAMGKRVDRALYDQAMGYLRSEVGQAVQSGLAMGTARLQQEARERVPFIPPGLSRSSAQAFANDGQALLAQTVQRASMLAPAPANEIQTTTARWFDALQKARGYR